MSMLIDNVYSYGPPRLPRSSLGFEVHVGADCMSRECLSHKDVIAKLKSRCIYAGFLDPLWDSVGGTWLYGKYRWTLLMAITRNGRNNTIPIGYTLVEGETSDAWFFFLQCLRVFVTPQLDLFLISNRQKSIKSVVWRLNNNRHHVFCIRRISQSFMRTFKNIDMKKIVINVG